MPFFVWFISFSVTPSRSIHVVIVISGKISCFLCLSGISLYIHTVYVHICIHTYVKLLFCFFRVWSKLYNVVIVCSMQWSESPLCTHISPPSWAFLPPLHPTPLGHHRAPSWAICATEQLPTSCLFYECSSPSLSHLPLSHFVHMSILYVCISIPVLQIGSSVPFF